MILTTMQCVQSALYMGTVSRHLQTTLQHFPHRVANSILFKGLEEMTGCYALWKQDRKDESALHLALGCLRVNKAVSIHRQPSPKSYV